MSSSRTDPAARACGADMLREQAAGRAALARLAEEAVTGRDRSSLIEQVAAEAARALDVDCSCVLELLPDGDALLVRAGVGWPSSQLGRAVVVAGDGSLAQAALARDPAEPLVLDDVSGQSRVTVPELWRERGLASGAIARIAGRDRTLGLLGAFATRRREFSADELQHLRALAAVLAAGLARAAAEEERDDVLAREQAVRAQAEQLAIQRERARLAGALHDRLSQTLFSVALKLDWCAARLDRGSEIAARLGEVQQETGAMMDAIRGAIAELSADNAGALTSAERLRRLVGQFQSLTGVAAELTVTGEVSRLDRAREDVLHRIFQEALANVTKHARATSVAIRLDVGDERVSFEVADDGVGLPPGIDPAALLASAGHFGLRQMVHRIESIGGRLQLATNGTGVRLSGEMPIGEPRA